LPDEGSKKKLTLYVSEEVIEKAKKLDLNLSEITESVLRGYAFKPSELERESLIGAYKSLFETMTPLLKDYLTSVEVGKLIPDPGEDFMGYEPKIRLIGDGSFWITDFEMEKKFEQLNLYELYEPREILSNFIRALSDASEKRKEKIVDLKMVKGIIDLIVSSLKPADNKIEQSESREGS
jgi:hypothetical protein